MLVHVARSRQVVTASGFLACQHPPRAPTEAVKSYGAGARNPLKSKVPTAVSTVHVTTALPLWAMPGGLKLPSPKLSTTKIALPSVSRNAAAAETPFGAAAGNLVFTAVKLRGVPAGPSQS